MLNGGINRLALFWFDKECLAGSGSGETSLWWVNFCDGLFDCVVLVAPFVDIFIIVVEVEYIFCGANGVAGVDSVDGINSWAVLDYIARRGNTGVGSLVRLGIGTDAWVSLDDPIFFESVPAHTVLISDDIIFGLIDP